MCVWKMIRFILSSKKVYKNYYVHKTWFVLKQEMSMYYVVHIFYSSKTLYMANTYQIFNISDTNTVVKMKCKHEVSYIIANFSWLPVL